MNIFKFYSFLIFIFSISSTVIASPYMSGQLGSSCSNGKSDVVDCGHASRLAGGYEWDLSRKFKFGLETGFTLFQKTYSAKNYKPTTPWYSPLSASSTNDYLVEGNIQRFDFDVLGVLNYYVTQKFDLYVKAGEGFQKVKFKSQPNKLGLSSNTSNAAGLKFGFGLGYDIFKSLNLNCEFLHEAGKENHFLNKAAPSFSVLMVGIQYKLME